MGNNVNVSIDAGVARITMDDGKVNAMSAGMLRDIVDALDQAQQAEATVVLQGREGIFSAGFDLTTFQQGIGPAMEMMAAGVEVIERLLSFPFPVLTVCTGHAYPMGAFLMLSADVRFAVDGPWQIGMNEVAIGLTVPRFALELAHHRLTPPGVARITTAPMFAPQDALQLGYVDRVLNADQLETAVSEELERLVSLDMAHFARTKSRVNEKALRAIRAAADEEMNAVSNR